MCGGAVQTVVTDGPIHETTVSGLTPNASLYTFQVAAVNNQTTGPFGNLVNSTPGMLGLIVYIFCTTNLVVST